MEIILLSAKFKFMKNIKIKYLTYHLSLWLCLFFFNTNVATAHIDLVESPCQESEQIDNALSCIIDKSNKEALLILPGFGDKRKRRKKQRAFFQQLNYDLFIADFHSRKSMNLTVKNLEAYFEANELKGYKKIHVFSYILGSWTINEFIKKNGRQNICTIIYDRSPLQERAPRIVVDKLALMGKIKKGKVLKEFSQTPYPILKNDSIRIGIIVESKATRLVRIYKKTALSYGPISWNPSDLNQSYDDLFYTPLNHDQMYTRFDVIGDELIHFLEYGKFSNLARREPFEWDVFEKWKG